MQTDQKFKIALRITSETSDYFQEKLNTVKDGEKRSYLNSFPDNQNSIQAFLLSEDLEKKYPVNFSTTEKADGKKIFNGFLEKGKCSELGINFRLTITEVFQPDTKQYCYPFTVHFYKRPDVSDVMNRLFGKVQNSAVLQSEPEPVKPVQRKRK